MENPKIKNVSITSEKEITKEDIIKEAQYIWKQAQNTWKDISYKKEVKKGKKKGLKTITGHDHEVLDKLFEKTRNEHKEFASSYPTVLRHMIQDQWFEISAFRKYMDEVEKNPWTNDEQRMDSYTRYAELLLIASKKKEGHHDTNKTVIAAFRRDYRGRLQKEHDDFTERFEEYKKSIQEEEKQLDVEKKNDLIAAWRRLGPIAKVSDEKINDVAELVKEGVLSLDKFQSMVYDIRRILSGVDIETIEREYAEHERKTREKMENTTVQIPENMNKEAAERLRRLAEEKIQADFHDKNDTTAVTDTTPSDTDSSPCTELESTTINSKSIPYSPSS